MKIWYLGFQGLNIQFVDCLYVDQIVFCCLGDVNFFGYFQNSVCCIDELLQGIVFELFLVWCLIFVMIDKEQDIILCVILQFGIYFQFLWYIVFSLNVNWYIVIIVGGVVVQDIVLIFVFIKFKK